MGRSLMRPGDLVILSHPCSSSGIIRPMRESLLVLGSVVAIALMGLVTVAMTPPLMVELGFRGLTLGLLIGIPTGWWYHVVRYRTLAARMALLSQWWRRRVELHPFLTPDEYQRVRPWFVAGALGFVLSLTGGVAVLTGMLVIRFYP